MTTQTETKENGYPVKFVGFLAEYGHEALADYLKKQEAPAEILELAEALRGCVMLVVENDGQFITDGYNEAIGDNLAAIGRGLHFTGTTLHSPDSLMSV